MTINTTLYKALKAYQAVIDLMNTDVSFSTAHKLVIAKKELSTHADFYAEQEQKLIEKYGIRDEKTNKIILNGNGFQLPTDKVDDYKKEKEELDKVEVAVDLSQNKLPVLPSVKPATLEALMELFEFPEE